MATIQPTYVPQNDGTVLVTWGAMTTSDVGGPVGVGRYQSITIQVNSSGGGTAQIQGSNDATNYGAIGAALAAASITKLSVTPGFIQISAIAVATVQSVTALLSGRGS